MPPASQVKPKKWQSIKVLFDDGEFSVISGRYEGGHDFVLGERWNGNKKAPLGFPNVAGYPIWHVIPDFLSVPVLNGLLGRLADSSNPRLRRYHPLIQRELKSRSSLRPR